MVPLLVPATVSRTTCVIKHNVYYTECYTDEPADVIVVVVLRLGGAVPKHSDFQRNISVGL